MLSFIVAAKLPGAVVLFLFCFRANVQSRNVNAKRLRVKFCYLTV